MDHYQPFIIRAELQGADVYRITAECQGGSWSGIAAADLPLLTSGEIAQAEGWLARGFVEREYVRDFGNRLFRTLFVSDVLAGFCAPSAWLGREGGLRVVLELPPPPPGPTAVGIDVRRRRGPRLARAFRDRAPEALPAGEMTGKIELLDQAIEWHEKAIAIAPASPGTDVLTKARLALSVAYLDKGGAYREGEQYPEADASLDQAIDAAQLALAGMDERPPAQDQAQQLAALTDYHLATAWHQKAFLWHQFEQPSN